MCNFVLIKTWNLAWLRDLKRWQHKSLFPSCQWLEVSEMWDEREPVAEPDGWSSALWEVVLWWERRQRPCSGALQRDQPPPGCQTGHHHTRWSRSETHGMIIWTVGWRGCRIILWNTAWSICLFCTVQTNWIFDFRCLFIWGGRSSVGPPHIRALVTLWNRHATDAEKSELVCTLTVISCTSKSP